MSGLDHASVLAAFDVVYAAREVTDPDAFGPAVLAGLAGVVPADVLSFNEVDPAAGRLVFAIEPVDYAIPPGSPEVLAELMSEHPLIAYMTETGDGSARRISDVWSAEQWHASRVYREFYQQQGIEHQLSIALPGPTQIFVGIALNRGSVEFSDRDVAVLDLIRPHLAQSWRQAREHQRVRALVRSTSDVLTATGSRAILLTDPPHELTDGALAELIGFFGRPGQAGGLPPRVERWIERERAALRDPDQAQLLRPLQVTVGDQRAVVRFLPAAAGHADALLVRNETVAAHTAQVAALGLSPREVEVVELVATGASNIEIAAQLHVAPSTIKKHLDRIYAKLGVSGRGRVTAILAEMVAHHREPDPNGAAR